jgi:hypothetical protein
MFLIISDWKKGDRKTGYESPQKDVQKECKGLNDCLYPDRVDNHSLVNYTTVGQSYIGKVVTNIVAPINPTLLKSHHHHSHQSNSNHHDSHQHHSHQPNSNHHD